MRIRGPKTTVLIFASDKMAVAGAKSENDSRLVSHKYARIVQKLGFDAKFRSSRSRTSSAAVTSSSPCGQFSSYEPELFPGLIYRMARPKVVLLIFVSGKIVVLTGTKVCSFPPSFSRTYGAASVRVVRRTRPRPAPARVASSYHLL
ncbi:hypothetical protein B0H14DRAFT_2890741, partial [Mycena olivaceomarginata]